MGIETTAPPHFASFGLDRVDDGACFFGVFWGAGDVVSVVWRDDDMRSRFPR